jgi:hypothetical protein
MGRNLRPSVCAATTFKNYLIAPLQATKGKIHITILMDTDICIYQYITLHIYYGKFSVVLYFEPKSQHVYYGICHTLSFRVAGCRSLEKTCGKPRSLEKTGLYISTCLSCGGADRRQKISDSTVPVAAAGQIVISRWQTLHH